MNNKILISIIVIALVILGFFILSKTPESKCGDGLCDKYEQDNPNLCLRDCEIITPTESNARDSFFEVHMEPSTANEETFNELINFVDLADEYGVKLTLLFTPPWAEMIIGDNGKHQKLIQLKINGHEVGAHHHGPNVCPWDGYTDLDINSQEFKDEQNKVPCPNAVRNQEVYLGDMNDFMGVLNQLGSIKIMTPSNPSTDWTEGPIYMAGGTDIDNAISNPELFNYKGYSVYRVSSVPLEDKILPRTGEKIELEEIEEEYLSDKRGIFGVVAHPVDYKNSPELYKGWFEFLDEQDSEMKHAKTISQVIEN